MIKVEKRDGTVVVFDRNKITSAIAKAIYATNEKTKGRVIRDKVIEDNSKNATNRVIRNLYKKFDVDDVPNVEDVQDMVIKVLMELGLYDVAENYINYRTERTRIRESKSRLMKTIEEITFLDAKESDMKRDNANIDGNSAMGTMLQYGSAVSKEFAMTQNMDPRFSNAHKKGDIHIHDMDFLNMGTLTCCQIDLAKLFKNGFSTGHGFIREPQDIRSYASLAAIAIQANQNDQHGGQSIPQFDYYLAPGVHKTFKKCFYDDIRKWIEIKVGSVKENLNEELKRLEEENVYPSIDMYFDYKRENELFVPKLFKYILKRYSLTEYEIRDMLDWAIKDAYDCTRKRTYQAMEAFIHNLNTMHSRAGAQVPFSSINFGTDTTHEGRLISENLMLAQEAGLGNGETPIFPILIFKVKEGVNYNKEDPNYDLFKLAMRVSAKRLFPNFSFIDAPFNLQYYKSGNPDTETTYMGCRTRVMGNVNGEETAPGRGNISFTSINLPRIALEHGLLGVHGKCDLDGFYEELDNKLSLVVEQLLERYEIQINKKVKNFPFLMGQGIWRDSDCLNANDTLESVVKQGTLTIGFIGLAECLKALIGEHHGESAEAQKLGLAIIGHMRAVCDEATSKYGLNFSLIGTPAEGLSGRFTKMDQKIYGKIPGVTDRDYYTNSSHVPVYYPISAYKKIQLEAPYHALENGGHISYIEMDGDPLNNLEAFEAVIRCMKESGIGYGSINHPVDRDSVCGYSGIIDNHICPKCGRDETQSEIKFDKIRRITGYLVGTIDRFNDGKRNEEKDRIKHSI